MKQIALDDCILEAMVINTNDDMAPLLENLQINLSEKFRRGAGAFQASNFAKKVITMFSSIYKTLSSETKKLRKQNSRYESQFFRAYCAYIASEGMLDMLKRDEGEAMQSATVDRTPTNFNLSLDSTDQTTLVDAINNYYQFMLGLPLPSHAKADTVTYLEVISYYARERMDEPFFAKYKEKFKDTVVVGKDFKVDGIKERPKVTSPTKTDNFRAVQENNFKKLEEIALNPVRRDEIVGNLEGIEAIETEVNCLAHWDPKERRNPFNYQQFILLVGKTGTGKTMLARYGMTLLRYLATKNNRPFSLGKLNFENHWQCGPLENIRYQLTEISEGNRIYMVFVDEFDTKFASRTTAAMEGHKNDVVGEFLRFRGGGDYVNRGNFIMIGATNEPKKIDPAILNVFKIIELPGPMTAEEKLQVLYNNLVGGIEQGYVRVAENEWPAIGKLLYKQDLNGRDIVNVAREAQEKYRRIASKISPQANASETERIIRTILSKDGAGYVTTQESIINSIMKQAQKAETEKMSYLPGAG